MASGAAKGCSPQEERHGEMHQPCTVPHNDSTTSGQGVNDAGAGLGRREEVFVVPAEDIIQVNLAGVRFEQRPGEGTSGDRIRVLVVPTTPQWIGS